MPDALIQPGLQPHNHCSSGGCAVIYLRRVFSLSILGSFKFLTPALFLRTFNACRGFGGWGGRSVVMERGKGREENKALCVCGRGSRQVPSLWETCKRRETGSGFTPNYRAQLSQETLEHEESKRDNSHDVVNDSKVPSSLIRPLYKHIGSNCYI